MVRNADSSFHGSTKIDLIFLCAKHFWVLVKTGKLV